MDCLLFYFILFVTLCTKDVWCRRLVAVRELLAANYTDDKIVGGNDTTIVSQPYMCYLLLFNGRDYFECGGSIVNENNIVTAAHCLPGIRSITVRIGSTDKTSGGKTYETTTFFSHPRYDPDTFDYDVAIVKVNESMELDGYSARAIGLVNINNDPEEGQNLTISGWGKIEQGGASTNTLKVARVPVVGRERCNQLIPSGVTSKMICGGYDEGGVDTCQGDSGGPAVLANTGTLAGITSHGYGCAKPNSPGVYTRVGHFQIRTYIMLMTGA